MSDRFKTSPPSISNLSETTTSNSSDEAGKFNSEEISGINEFGVSQRTLSKENNEEDLVLWKKLKDGDINALGCLYDAYIDVLFPYGLSLVSDRVLIMDCIHDLFVDLFKYRKKLAGNPQVKFYLLKSLKRKIFKKTKVVATNLQSANFQTLFHLDLCETSAEKKIIDNEIVVERKALVDRAFAGLTKKQKKALHLKFYEGKSYKEIAILMNVTIESSRTLVYRGITFLRKRIMSIFAISLVLF